MTPRLLDLFCCAGGAGMGYHRAGFDVTGVDINPQPNYPFRFFQTDALDVLRALPTWARIIGEAGYDAVHASPPCPAHSALRHVAPGHDTGWMLAATRDLLMASGLPWVLENVVGADMPGAVLLCGKHFGLSTVTESRGLVYLRRHRLFEASFQLADPGPHPHPRGERTIGVYGNGSSGRAVFIPGGPGGWKGSVEDRRAAMGIDWTTGGELSQAIPPAYTQWIGTQLLAHLAAPVAVAA